jgi:hypothetical protein
VSVDLNLTAAIARLRGFRNSWNAGDLIDEDSKLSADDLDTILDHLAPAPVDTTAHARAE